MPEFGTGRVRKTDARDKLHPMKVPLIKTKDLVAYDTGPALDQKMTDRCAGFVFRALLNAPPFQMKGGPSEIEIFRGAKRMDGIPGSDYFGTTIRGAAEYLQKLGVIGEYVWGSEAEQVLNWMRAQSGPVIIGSDVPEGFLAPNKNTIVRATGKNVGSHYYLLTAVDDINAQVEITNSWGSKWGKHGRAWLSFADLRKLLKAQGEAMGVKRPNDKWDGPKRGTGGKDD